jgi:uncharacterized protein YecT (DUF1311 family)
MSPLSGRTARVLLHLKTILGQSSKKGFRSSIAAVDFRLNDGVNALRDARTPEFRTGAVAREFVPRAWIQPRPRNPDPPPAAAFLGTLFKRAEIVAFAVGNTIYVVTDPRGPESGVRRVDRGGSWNRNAVNCRAADRNGLQPGFRNFDLGFRPALVPLHSAILQPQAFELTQSPRAMEATVARASSGYGLERVSQNYDPRVKYQKFSPAQLNEVESLIRSDNLCKSADAEMEAVYVRMRSNFGQNAAKKDSLKADQLNWLYFRTSVLNSVPISLRSPVFVQLTRERVNYLRVW